MESTRQGRGVGGQAQPSRQLLLEEYRPQFDWTHDAASHILLIDLTGFKKDDVKLQVDNMGKIIVSGELRVSEDKHIWFKQIFNMPSDSNNEKISGKFDNGLLFVIMPRKQIQGKEEPEKEFQNDGIEKEGKPTNKEKLKEEIKKDGKKKEENSTHKKEQEEEIQKDSMKKEGTSINKEELEEEILKDNNKNRESFTDKEEKSRKEDDDDNQGVKDSFDNEEIQAESDDDNQGDKKETQEESDDDNQGVKDSFDDKDGKVERHGKEELEKDISKKGTSTEDLGEKRDSTSKQGLEDDLYDKIMETIKNNKAFIATAILAFSFGFYVSRKLKGSG